MDPLDTKKRIFAAYKLLTEKTTSKQKIESVKILIKGVNPKIDTLLENSTKALSELEKFHKGEIIELTAEHLPENTDEDKKRKKALLWFIRNWKSLHGEIDRVKKELEVKSNTADQDIAKMWKIASSLKGPLGITTAFAVIVVIGLSIFGGNKNKTNIVPSSTLQITNEPVSIKEKIKVIVVDGKQIPLTELTTGQGQECMDGNIEAPHYHAKDHVAAKALDGFTVSDPGGCGFGMIKVVQIVEVE
ncbi:hypothetical protein A2954_01845 [Candidatus Roizmanbacteria bacterium RIFCSPLOWO2_01_FULL_37_12]|uniref:Uncharacterized protein n=1 Tax=Candidatus Roizmanbacteria bacterium RIFCSPLOWO2_01_FULL_37_12 TaxID=1802056 RepID=A0A1F7I9F7_9BACT|nr:MAG: hypothetical protein A2768_01145 [Candidatus Roizmanbacteria bacterium RIFCSPHIGHO2_01_FULL_37_16]OGK24492.1 MAG: hypothetical protein A3D76_05680 [Candidatus Roizmanbacteria bacterium RIFCSPHIGHO2_02_FULL_37_9b]OGK39989.1 MAG: hypothetical protein A2954_01845 [Candidatus Roizmanbacteria bacterium RIFCSPLOWO2_01_FULL_37_12]